MVTTTFPTILHMWLYKYTFPTLLLNLIHGYLQYVTHVTYVTVDLICDLHVIPPKIATLNIWYYLHIFLPQKSVFIIFKCNTIINFDLSISFKRSIQWSPLLFELFCICGFPTLLLYLILGAKLKYSWIPHMEYSWGYPKLYSMWQLFHII